MRPPDARASLAGRTKELEAHLAHWMTGWQCILFPHAHSKLSNHFAGLSVIFGIATLLLPY